jgi:hypothetical protein
MSALTGLGHRPTRHGAATFVGWLLLAIVIVGATVTLGVLLIARLSSEQPNAAAVAVATESPSPTSWLIAIAPGQVRMPDGADCTACHLTASGGVGVKPIPALAHPVHGWTNCTACHSNASLVQTAPGHSGIHADQCLICHTQASEPAPTPPHDTMPDMNCLSCHGTIAPLSDEMAGRDPNLCWLCHHK